MMRLCLSLLVVALLASPPALARHGRDDHRGAAGRVTVSQEAAVERARAEGVARLREVKLRDGRWKVEGWTSQGRAIEVEIDAATGAVVKREIYGGLSGGARRA